MAQEEHKSGVLETLMHGLVAGVAEGMVREEEHAPATAVAGYPHLVADIGGTNARFGLVHGPGQQARQVRKLPVAEHAGPAEAARAYLDALGADSGGKAPKPHRAAFAVATPTRDDRIVLTNSHWNFSRREVEATLGLEVLLMLNDFEALALSLPRLQAAQLQPIGPLAPFAASAPGEGGTLAVVGPGTGLGVGAVIDSRHGWIALPGEGGHVTLPAADDFEAALLQWARKEFPHVSAERFLSGIGLPVLYRAVAGVLGVADRGLAAEQIVEQGLLLPDAGGDAACERVLDVFCAMLGGVAANLALTVGARNGVYIGGGIAPRLGDYFFRSRFRECFEAKGRFQGYLSQIPTALIIDTLAALTGAALAVEQHGR